MPAVPAPTSAIRSGDTPSTEIANARPRSRVGQVTTLRLGARSTILALAQATLVADDLRTAHPRLRVQLVTIPTHGDRWADNFGAGTGIQRRLHPRDRGRV
ncbi:hypothetical protein Cme02nite_51260 [Catellatospora methionotrophica]|uniref:Porphobilinogen deaminase N-terminal domain-containing protein n=1 Tax=Catellatospora methionotrophica TaxID=121620 RepID=A0A8J3LJG6_9ACTN|nr:hypothetical protein [Catellatospora methionotrophica]GIG16794.1 hypothetical protein Cme02nite_51260 [Catellatospora methionotrophica]